MKKTAISLIIGSLLSTAILPNIVSATEFEGNNLATEEVVEKDTKTVIENQTVVVDGEVFYISVEDNGDTISNHVTDKNGTITFTTDVITRKVSVSSDFLSNEEISEMESNVNATNVGIEFMYSNNTGNENQISPMAQTGSWAWSSWQNKTVTANGIFTAQSIIGAVGGAFGIYGSGAATIANIWIQYNIKTGYFKYRAGSRLDTDPAYYWTKNEVKFYKESTRKTLLKTTSSTAQKYYLHP